MLDRLDLRSTEILSLRRRLREQSTELAELRRRYHVYDRHGRRVKQAHDDALWLLAMHITGAVPSRRFCEQQGMSRRRWQNARALLELAGVCSGERWRETDANIANGLLTSAAARALETPAAFRGRVVSHGSA